MAFEAAPIRGQQMTIKPTGGQSRGMSVSDALAILDRFKSKGGSTDPDTVSGGTPPEEENFFPDAQRQYSSINTETPDTASTGVPLPEGRQYSALTSSSYDEAPTPQEIEAGQSGKYDDPLAETAQNSGFNLGDPNRAFAAPDMAKSELSINKTGNKTGMEGTEQALKVIMALYGGG